MGMRPRLLPGDLEAQLMPGSIAHAVHHMGDALDLSLFDAHYRNDDVDASAHAPAMLLKAVLMAYSQELVSSRAIERACRENVLFIALTGCEATRHNERRLRRLALTPFSLLSRTSSWERKPKCRADTQLTLHRHVPRRMS